MPVRGRGGARRSRRGRHRDGDRGSVLVLVPVGFLVLMLLGTMAVDSAVTYLGQRQLADALAAAANDAATEGLNSTAFYSRGAVALSPGTAASAACASLAAQGDGGLHRLHLDIGIDGRVVELRATAVVDMVFGRAIPGLGTRTVVATATAEAEQAPGAPAPPPPGGALAPVACG